MVEHTAGRSAWFRGRAASQQTSTGGNEHLSLLCTSVRDRED